MQLSGNFNLNQAKYDKNDEFYTQLADIEKEMRHYRRHFHDATVLCNCDNPFKSNFFKYFVLNYNCLGLKKLIATCYAGSKVISRRGSAVHPYKAVITCVDDSANNGLLDAGDIRRLFGIGENELTELDGDGGFRSEECLKLLDEADIVVTNPPFSLFREYIGVLLAHGKKFAIIGSMNAITYREVFPFIKEERLWLGATTVKEFVQPDGNVKKFGNICWYTNLDIEKLHKELVLCRRYSPEEYPCYENCHAIEVSRTANIPMDYYGAMGVPISFLNKWCPKQFEIIGSSLALATPIGKVAKPGDVYQPGGRRCYIRVGDHELKRLYDRILIRRKC